ncbi:DASH complex, subunit Spc34 [Poronia punctata]|nr:DASH complex, subunit Spc34 [Poronia punctata]
MSLLSVHFEQIKISCQGIDSLPFPPPKIFTNALCSNQDITSFIRDTEPHERAIFSVPPPPPTVSAKVPEPTSQGSRRRTVFNVASGEITTGAAGRGGVSSRKNTATAAVLGGELHDKIRKSERRGGKDDIDVEVLLKGAEKLCKVYPVPGALERIAAQREKYAHSCNTLAYYEAKVEGQTEALRQMNKDHWMDDDEDGDPEPEADLSEQIETEEDLLRIQEEVRELERKKKDLQIRLRSMEKDLGGLLHM